MRGARHVARLCALAWALGAAPDALRAQSSDTLFATGVRAYKNLEFDLAAWLLRRDLAKVSAAGAPIAARSEGLAPPTCSAGGGTLLPPCSDGS
ncbi:MAG: hypothetical protein DMD25_14375 [Gemmatimonadetes bacterium]|nr:MAG: hypothetical protein DMD25_14375 [Gemmatimonadota bacterium]